MSEKKTSLQLKEKRASLVANAKLIYDAASADQRELTEEEQAQFDALMGQADAAAAEAEDAARGERLEDAERSLRVPQPRKTSWTPEMVSNQGYRYKDGLRAWCLSGSNTTIKSQDLDAAAQHGFDVRSGMRTLKVSGNWLGLPPGVRSLPKSSLGGLIQDELADRVEKSLKFFGGMWDVAETIVTSTGNDFALPTFDDTGNNAHILSEESADSVNVDPTLSSVSIPVYKFTSNIVKASVEALQDSVVDLSQLLVDALTERIRRYGNTLFTTGAGSGSSQPNGIVTASSLGKQTASASAITYGEIIDLLYSVDPAYHDGAAFMMNSGTWAHLEKLLDGDDRPLVDFNGFGTATARSIKGFPVILNNAMATITNSAKVILFGQLSKYKIRLVQEIYLAKLDSLYMANFQVGFVMAARFGGNLADAGTDPVKYLQMAA